MLKAVDWRFGKRPTHLSPLHRPYMPTPLPCPQPCPLGPCPHLLSPHLCPHTPVPGRRGRDRAILVVVEACSAQFCHLHSALPPPMPAPATSSLPSPLPPSPHTLPDLPVPLYVCPLAPFIWPRAIAHSIIAPSPCPLPHGAGRRVWKKAHPLPPCLPPLSHSLQPCPPLDLPSSPPHALTHAFPVCPTLALPLFAFRCPTHLGLVAFPQWFFLVPFVGDFGSSFIPGTPLPLPLHSLSPPAPSLPTRPHAAFVCVPPCQTWHSHHHCLFVPLASAPPYPALHTPPAFFLGWMDKDWMDGQVEDGKQNMLFIWESLENGDEMRHAIFGNSLVNSGDIRHCVPCLGNLFLLL